MKTEYEARATAFNPTTYWNYPEHDLQHIAEEARQRSQDQKHINAYREGRVKDGQVKKEDGGPEDKTRPIEVPASIPMDLDTEHSPSKPYNPWEGDEMAKQLGETLDNFLARLPPSTTTVASGPWIWIANPASSQRPLQMDVAGLKTSGNELLEEYLDRKAKAETQNPGKPTSAITRILKADREWLEMSIIDLAKSKGVTTGKWMLFPHPKEVEEIWQKVAKATLEGTLGCSAKVATNDGSGSHPPVCIYTEDFTDKDDVHRVLNKMQELGLVKGVQGMYYKCDAYTYLNIMSGNDYKLKTSMYSSKEMLKNTLVKKW